MNISLLRRIFPVIALCLAVWSYSGKATAAWDGVIKIVVPYGPGGGNDSLARILANALSGTLASAVIVENKPGGEGSLAARAVMNAPADGRTLLLCASVTEIQSAKANPLYDVSKDLAPVVLGFEAPYVLIANPDLPVKSMNDLIDYARQNPGKLSYASFGAGSAPHLAFELLKQRTNISIVHVPYRTNSEATSAVLSGQVQLAMDTYALAAQHVNEGRVRAIATTGIERDQNAPDLPTIAESGIAGYNIVYTGGIMAHKDTPKETIENINKAINDALTKPDTVMAIKRLGFSVVGGASSRYQETLDKELGVYRKLISSAGIVF
jgi:tripartite-type tricarboxylate transporter receptor subunit TctC